MTDVAANLDAALGDRYRILGEVGRGGMAVVYLADDLKHSRRVAIKVLARELGESVGTERFLREIGIAARLSHPRIVPLLDSGSAAGLLYYVMPYVEGETLAAKLEREGPLPVEEAAEIARQVASALAYAHEQGIVHRDIKPDNILLSGGEAVVADFGIARALTAAGGTTLTGSGIVVGTPLYMSPEQAGGAAEPDARSDIYSLGCVLYELLAGAPPFEARTAQGVAARKLSESAPDVRAARETTPAALAAVVRKALARVPADRYRTAAELAEALRGAEADGEAAPDPAWPPAGRAWWRPAGVGAAAALVVLLVASNLGWLERGGGRAPGLFVELPVDGMTELLAPEVALSPDGRRIAYLSDDRLWVRDLDALEPRQVPGSEGARLTFWSPDGREVGFAADGRIWRAPAEGGESVAVGSFGNGLAGGSGATWTRDGDIVFATGSTALKTVRARGGVPRELIPLRPDEQDHHHPHELPEGRGILFVPHHRHGFDTIEVLAGGERRELLRLEGQSIRDPAYSATGHILFETTGAIWAVPFSLRRLEVTGEPFLLVSGAWRPSVDRAATLAFFRGPAVPGRELAFVDRNGEIERMIGGPARFEFFNVAPTGGHVAVTMNDPGGVWILDAEGATRRRPTAEGEWANFPRWSPDGGRVAYLGTGLDTEPGVRIRAADGTGSTRYIARAFYPTFTPDGRRLVMTLGSPVGEDWSIGYVDLDRDGDPVPVLATPARECCQHVSPDGRYMAYASDASGRWEVYITRFPGAQGTWQISPDGGSWPRWDPAAGRLYYARGVDIMEVDVATGAGLELSSPRRLFSRPARIQDIRLGKPDYYDVAPGGERFLVVLPTDAGESTGTVVVMGDWPRAFVPPPSR